MYFKSSAKPLVTDARKKGARCILLVALGFLLRPGVAEAVKVEFDTESSTNIADVSLNASLIVWNPSIPGPEPGYEFEDLDSWSGSGKQYEGSSDVSLGGISYGPCTASVEVSVSASGVSYNAYPELGGQSIEGQTLHEIRFYVDASTWPCPPLPQIPDSPYILTAYNCDLVAAGEIVWDLLPSTEDEEIGTPVVVSFGRGPIGYSLGGQSGGTVYEFCISGWYQGVAGREMEGPYEICNYADPPNYYADPPPIWQNLDIRAAIGDKIRLVYTMEGEAHQQDELVPSNLTPDGEHPTMGLSVAVWVEPLFLPDLIGEFSVTGFRNPPDPGATLQAEMEVVVSNIGTTATEPKDTIDLKFFLRPIDALDNSGDILVSTLYNESIGKLAPGRSKRMALSVPISIPAFTNGTYILGVMHVDSSNDITELDEDNNTAVASECVIIVSNGIPLMRPDLTGKFSQVRFWGSPTPGAKGRAEIDVSNIGTIETEAKQVIDIDICLRTSSVPIQDITLLTLNDQSVSKLKPGSSKTFRATFELPAGLSVGEYQLVAKIDSSEAVEELNEDNNEALSTVFEVMTQ